MHNLLVWHLLLLAAVVLSTLPSSSAEPHLDATVFTPAWRVSTNLLLWSHANQLGIYLEILRDYRGTNAPFRNLGASAGIGYSVFGPSVVPLDVFACFGWDFCAKLGFSARYAYILQSDIQKQQFINWPDARWYLAPFLDLMYSPYDNGVQVGLGCEYVFDVNYEIHIFMPRLTFGYVF